MVSARGVYIALGSNLRERAENLRFARERMDTADLQVLRVSSIYETEPRGLTEQPWFLNQVLEVETTLSPPQLLARLLDIECDMGRKRDLPNGPRIIDLDIILYGDRVVSEAGLQVPHPRMIERRFVLEPLAELAAELYHPIHRRTVSELLDGVMDQTVRRTST